MFELKEFEKEIFRILPAYKKLSKEKKLQVLELLKEWLIREIEENLK